ALESFAVDRLGYGVAAQTQRDVFNLLDRMGQRCDAGGIDRLHLLDEAEKIVELGTRVLSVGVGQFEPREMRDALYIGQGQGHAVTGNCGGLPQNRKRRCDSKLRRIRTSSKKGRRRQKVPSVSFKTSKIIRYDYAFDPNPDRLTKALLNNSQRTFGYFGLGFATASGRLPRSFAFMWRNFRPVEAVIFPLPPYANVARPGPQRDRILNVRFFAQLLFQRSSD